MLSTLAKLPWIEDAVQLAAGEEATRLELVASDQVAVCTVVYLPRWTEGLVFV